MLRRYEKCLSAAAKPWWTHEPCGRLRWATTPWVRHLKDETRPSETFIVHLVNSFLLGAQADISDLSRLSTIVMTETDRFPTRASQPLIICLSSESSRETLLVTSSLALTNFSISCNWMEGIRESSLGIPKLLDTDTIKIKWLDQNCNISLTYNFKKSA